MKTFSSKTLSVSLLLWVPLAMTTIAVTSIVFFVAQQQYRQLANDPQIQVARDAAALVRAGQAPETLVPTEKVNMVASLSPFIAVYNQDGHLILGSGVLHERMPTPPPGIFTYAKAHGEYRVTWEPQTDVRIAAVVIPFDTMQGGYIVVGRNLRETEQRIADLTDLVMFVLPLTLAATLIICLYLAWLKERLDQ